MVCESWRWWGRPAANSSVSVAASFDERNVGRGPDEPLRNDTTQLGLDQVVGHEAGGLFRNAASSENVRNGLAEVLN